MFTHVIYIIGILAIGDVLLGAIVGSYFATRFCPTEHLKGLFWGLLIGGFSAFWCGVLLTLLWGPCHY